MLENPHLDGLNLGQPQLNFAERLNLGRDNHDWATLAGSALHVMTSAPQTVSPSDS